MIRDSNMLRVYFYTEATNTCVYTPMDPLDAVSKCLPASATFNTTSTLGMGPGSMDVQVWNIVKGDAGQVTETIGLQGPYNGCYVPVFLQDSRAPDNVIMYSNVHTNVTDTGVFDIPVTCTPQSVV